MSIQTRRTTSPSGILTVIILAQFVIGIDYNIVFVALPELQPLGFDSNSLQWVIGSYAIAFGGFLLIGGRLVDYCGAKLAFLVGIALYGFGSLLGGCAFTSWMLLLGRAIEGLGGAALAPALLALLVGSFAEGASRNRALSLWSAAGSVGMVVGSIVGGVLIQVFDWRSIFFLNIPITLVIVALVLAFVPASTSTSYRGSFDIVGAVTATSAATSLVLGLTCAPELGWTDPLTLVTLGVAAVLTVLFLIVEWRSANPLVPLGLFRNRELSAGTMVVFLFACSFGALAYFMTLYFQEVRSLAPVATGIAFILPCFFVLLGTLVGGRLTTKVGPRTALLMSLPVGFMGCVLCALVLDPATPWVLFYVAAALFSLAQGIVFVAMFAAATTGLAESERGIAGGITNSALWIGMAVGLAILVTISANAGEPSPENSDLITIGMTAIAVVIGLTILATLRLPKRAISSSNEPDEPTNADVETSLMS